MKNNKFRFGVALIIWAGALQFCALPKEQLLRTADHVNCAVSAIRVSDYRATDSSQAWRAQCRGREFVCMSQNDDDPTCTQVDAPGISVAKK